MRRMALLILAGTNFISWRAPNFVQTVDVQRGGRRASAVDVVHMVDMDGVTGPAGLERS